MGNINKELKKSISITVDIEIYEKLKNEAVEELRNVSSMISYILKGYYQDKDNREANK